MIFVSEAVIEKGLAPRRTLVYDDKTVPHPGSLSVQVLRTQLASVLSVNISVNPFVIIKVDPLGL